MDWITSGFEGFSKGTFENGGQNLYVSKKGVLQRIFQYDVNQDGHPDILFACSQSMFERPPVHVYKDLNTEPLVLPAGGTYTATLADLHGNGYEDLILASQNDGTHNDITAIIYFGSAEGLTEHYRMELPAPNSTDVVTGDFNADGKQEIIFLSNGKLRMFCQYKAKGFNPSQFVDYDVAAKAIAAGDLNGDGITDLVVAENDGSVAVLFGGKDGLKVDEIVRIQTAAGEAAGEAGTSTAGLSASAAHKRPAVLSINGKTYLCCIEDDDVCLYTCKDNAFEKVQSINCPNAVGAVAGDLTGNGCDDLAVTVFTDRDTDADCRIYLGDKDGICADRYVTVAVKGAVSATMAQYDGAKVIFCRTGESIEQNVGSPVVEIVDGKAVISTYVYGGDCQRILAGRPSGKADRDTIIVPNHKLNRCEGGEDVYIYLGGKDGYCEERRIGLPAHSAVDGSMVDFFDSGNVDVLVTSCFEDAPYLDDGCYIYTNDGNGLDPNRKVTIPTVRAHGVAIGDFRKSGYLDMVFGGFQNRELRVFHGSENGYSLDNCTRILLGSDEDDYVPYAYKKGQPWDTQSEEEKALISEFGQVRWLLSADFNNDGWLDLFVSEILGPRCFIFWGGPEGFSKDRMTVLETDGVASATVADLNKDGYPDLLLGQHMSTKKPSRYESYITVYWGGPDGYQENRKMQLPASCANAVTVGDYRGTGNLDIYASAYNNGRFRDLFSYLYNADENGNYSTRNMQYLFNHSGSGCVSGDFNGDGYTDLAVACHKEYGNHCSHSFIFWGGPNGLSDERKTILPTTGPHGMCTVDPGNIMDRGDRERYTSEVMDIAAAKVQSIAWEGNCTSTSWVELEMRAAADAAAIENAEWTKVEAGADISALNLTGCVQYRIALCAKCSCGTPRITAVKVQYA